LRKWMKMWRNIFFYHRLWGNRVEIDHIKVLIK
jgi:hypothetical protein